MTKFEKLIAKRSAFDAQLRNFETYINTFTNDSITDVIIENLKARVARIQSLFDNFEEIQLDIEIASESLEEDFKIRADIETRAFDLISISNKHISQFNPNKERLSVSNESIINSQNSFQAQNIKLPTIELPSFSGNFVEWRAFEDTFLALIHRNESLSKIQKLCYLKSSLKGEAYGLIKTLDTIESNYDIALGLVSERYSHHRRIVYSHINSLLTLKPVTLKSFINSVEQNIRALESLGIPTQEWDAILIPLLLSKLDMRLNREWEAKLVSSFKKDELPSYKTFISFLLEKSEATDIVKSYTPVNMQPNTKFNTKSFASTYNPICPLCKDTHKINVCKQFLNQNLEERVKTIKSLHMCLNCFRSGHVVKDCKASRCKECGAKHHTTLHTEKVNNQKENKVTNESTPSTSSATNCATQQLKSTQVLLSTAEVLICDNNNKMFTVRALLDSASQSNFITKSFCEKLNINKHDTRITIFGVNQKKTPIKHCTTVKIKSKTSNYTTNLSCLIMDKITENLPHASFDKNLITIPNHVTLADNHFNVSKPIDLLIGADTFWDIITSEKICKNNNLPILQNTKLGWIVAGQLPFNNTPLNTRSYHCCELNEQLQNLWKLDEFSANTSILSDDEQFCEDNFNQTTKRDNDGRFIVKIPFKNNLNQLGETKNFSLKRFYSLEARLNRNPQVKEMYAEFLKEYEDLGHMTKVKEDQLTTPQFFLPHHHVIREASTTTKLRVVFDGSLKSSTGLSLNNVQHSGPVLQTDLFSILIRFRKHTFVVTADINKMYRQILIDKSQRQYQQIFWRNNSDEKIDVYQLNTVTYGTASAPYLAIRCLHELGRANENNYPKESQIIKNDFYVDDLLTGANNLNELTKVCNNIINILSSAKFHLHKWNSNSPCLQIDGVNLENKSLCLNNISENKTLGIIFDPLNDTFHFSFKDYQFNTKTTKRTVLSMASKVFDPLGLLSPIMIVPKLIIQKLWKLKCGWDQSIPENIKNEWNHFRDNCAIIDDIKIPRHCVDKSANKFHLHGFADASESAYGACVYIKSLFNERVLNVHLVASKSRVAPVKKISLPRLELCAATLLAQLISRICEILEIDFEEKHYWSDSQITLAWINGCPSSWNTFVANRVSEIQNLTDKQYWHHVNSNKNPADAISRGMSPLKLKHHKIWWHGPEFLFDNITPQHLQTIDINNIPEKRSPITLITLVKDKFLPFEKFSNLRTLINVITYCKRFIANCKRQRTVGPLSASERNSTLNTLIKIAQNESYAKEIDALEKKKQLASTSSILSLNPFLDQLGIMRVGGRLQNSQMQFHQKHQIILPYKHPLTMLIAKTQHEINLHCGPQQLLYNLRESYWPIKGKTLTKFIIHKCLKCYKANPRPHSELMGNLPSFRVTPAHPFEFCGVDYAGPMLSRTKRSRGYKSFKVYVCLFICLTTKAIHLELVDNLSSEAFIATLRRFVSRRGKPRKLFSDNGTNFVGANNELKRFQQIINKSQNEIINAITNEGNTIEWEFIPPRSPHFGGMWESSIKLVKKHLTKVIGKAILTFNELYTILTQIEATVNSRPLCPLSDDPRDLLPLTPAHFLIGRSYSTVADENVELTNENRLTHYQRLQQLKQHFWRRWSKEYIQQLQNRQKWKKSQDIKLKVNTLVLLVNENEPPCVWKMARISELHPGKDGKVRVVTVSTSNGTFKRAINKICILPINDSFSET